MLYIRPILFTQRIMCALPLYHRADPELQRRGGQICAEIFQRPFFRRAFLKKFLHFPQKMFIYLPKFLMTFSLVIDLFQVLIQYFSVGGAKSVGRHRQGGQNPYLSTNSQCYHYSFCSRGGQTPLPTSMEGPWPDWSLLDPPLALCSNKFRKMYSTFTYWSLRVFD